VYLLCNHSVFDFACQMTNSLRTPPSQAALIEGTYHPIELKSAMCGGSVGPELVRPTQPERRELLHILAKLPTAYLDAYQKHLVFKCRYVSIIASILASISLHFAPFTSLSGTACAGIRKRCVSSFVVLTGRKRLPRKRPRHQRVPCMHCWGWG
jgi:hypothetical protein